MRALKVESSQKVSRGILSPYWNNNYTSTSVLSKSDAGIEQRIFTGHEFDDESDLTYAKQRYYDQDIGKFLSQDPASRDRVLGLLEDPQLFNMYGYGRNNPINYNDPTGEVPNRVQAVNYNQIINQIKSIENNNPNSSFNDIINLSSSHFGPFGNLGPSSPRYVYTNNKGWIDFRHFFRAGSEAIEKGSLRTKVLGFGVELRQLFTSTERPSAFSYEDLPSNSAGIDFVGLKESFPNASPSSLLKAYLKVSGAIDPHQAPNYNSLPEDASSGSDDVQRNVTSNNAIQHEDN